MVPNKIIEYNIKDDVKRFDYQANFSLPKIQRIAKCCIFSPPQDNLRIIESSSVYESVLYTGHQRSKLLGLES